MEIIDSHHHVWDLSAHDQPFLRSDPSLAPLLRTFSLADLGPAAAAAGVTGTVVVQTLTGPGETPELLALAASGGLVSAVVGWADLAAPDVAGTLDALRAGPGGDRLAGLRHPLLGEPDADWLDRPAVRRGLAAAGAAGLAYDILGEPRHLPAAARAAAALPDLRFVLNHLGNPPAGGPPDPAWAAAIAALAACPNVSCKLSGVLGRPEGAAAVAPLYDTVLTAFGPARLMFGSDWPVSTLRAGYGEVVAIARALTSDLRPAEQRDIFSGTARRAYRLGS
jgi:L-fuconolactonase